MSVEIRPAQWSSYVAVGDSFTEGMCDADPSAPGEYIGWADRLALELADRTDTEFRYANLAVRGRLLDDITGVQVPAALELRPSLISIIGGGNDCLRPGADPERLANQLEQAVVVSREAGADVLLSVPVDPQDSPFVRRTRGTVAVFSMHIWSIAQRHGCHVLDLWGFKPLRDWAMWAPDRIHMTTEGHRRVALAALVALGHQPMGEDWREPLPAQPPLTRAEQLRSDAQWAKEYVGPWVQRRLTGRSSGDGRSAKRPGLVVVPRTPSSN